MLFHISSLRTSIAEDAKISRVWKDWHPLGLGPWEQKSGFLHQIPLLRSQDHSEPDSKRCARSQNVVE